MAYMIPETPRDFNINSKEGMMFESLEKLPRDYYVVHSLKATDFVKGALLSREADFVIFHPDKGIIVLECKGGFPKYENGMWYYGMGKPMGKGGPYRQAETAMHAIEDSIRMAGCEMLLSHCALYYGVWFPSLSKENLKSQPLPPEADMRITMTMEDVPDPENAIERIFSIQKQYNHEPVKHKLSPTEADMLLKRFICPKFQLAPTVLESKAETNIRFHKLLDEQKKILDFLEDQPVAVINGAAGTGKTWVALEKARRHAEEGESVLFLCYNRQLKDFLEKRAKNYLSIHFYSIDGFACTVCGTKESDYAFLNKKLQNMFMEDSFPYQHIIIDEGQDFGQDFIEENGIMQLLCDMVTTDESKNGTFYVFYDRLQTIQGKQIPKFIEEADCRLTLTRNCRNTENIAKTSLAPVTQRKMKLFPQAIPGEITKIAFCEDADQVVKAVDAALIEFGEESEKNTVILTCETMSTSILAEKLQNGKYKSRITFTTCRKFKGLEADNVILVDVNEQTFNSDDVMRYYVGTSRARTGLRIITTLDDEGCINILTGKFDYPADKPIKNPKGKLADKLNAVKMKFD